MAQSITMIDMRLFVSLIPKSNQKILTWSIIQPNERNMLFLCVNEDALL